MQMALRVLEVTLQMIFTTHKMTDADGFKNTKELLYRWLLQ